MRAAVVWCGIVFVSSCAHRAPQTAATLESTLPSVERTIVFDEAMVLRAPHPSVWIQAGDSTRIELQEGVRRHDVVAAETRSHDRWLISDTSVAAIRTAPLAPGLDRMRDGYAPLRWILAKTPGRATLSAFDIVPYSGPPATNEPPTRINHEVVVIPRLQSLRIAAIRDTVGYGEPVRVRVETRDMNDRVVRGVPVAVRSPIAIVTVTDSGGAYVSAPGSHVLVAQFWQLRDSVRVVIRPPARR